AAHLALARAAVRRGELLLGGALADPADGAVLLFRADSPAPVEAFAAADPSVLNGLVTRRRVRPRTTVVGTARPSRCPSRKAARPDTRRFLVEISSFRNNPLAGPTRPSNNPSGDLEKGADRP